MDTPWLWSESSSRPKGGCNDFPLPVVRHVVELCTSIPIVVLLVRFPEDVSDVEEVVFCQLSVGPSALVDPCVFMFILELFPGGQSLFPLCLHYVLLHQLLLLGLVHASGQVDGYSLVEGIGCIC